MNERTVLKYASTSNISLWTSSLFPITSPRSSTCRNMYFMSSPSLVDNLLLNYRVNSLPSSDDLANTTVPFYNNSACWLWDMHELVCTYHHHEFNIHPSLLSNEVSVIGQPYS